MPIAMHLFGLCVFQFNHKVLFWAKTFSSVLTYECKKLYFIGF